MKWRKEAAEGGKKSKREEIRVSKLVYIILRNRCQETYREGPEF